MRPEHWVHTIPLRLRSLFRRSLADHELDEELRYHIESKTAHHVSNGMSPEQARRAALLELGGIEQTKEACRDQRKLNLIEDLVQDVSHGLRLLRKNSGFTAIAVLTLALGIGANTAIFTLIHAVMLKTLPVAKPGELYRLGDDDNCCVVGGLQGNFSIFSHALYKHLRDNTPEFSQLAAFDAAPAKFSVRRSESSGPAVPFIGEFVSGNYFQMFGVDAVSGRVLTNEDDRPGEAPVAVLSYRTWRDQFGLAPSVVHSTLIINGFAVVVTGVAPPGFYGDTLRSDPPDFWLPLASEPTFHHERPLLNEAGEHWLYVIGRLKQDAEPVAVQTRVTVELQQWLSEYGDLAPEERNSIQQQKIILAPAAGGVETLSAEYAEGFRLLMIASGLVLLIACANIACLLLAQGSAARLATAIRVALGATRSRLIRQALSEGVLLALLGGAAGLAVAYFGARAILLIAFRGARFVPIDAAPSVPVLGFALAVSLLTGLIFSSAPAWMASKVLPGEILGGAGRSRQDRTSLPRRSLVVLQTSLSLILLVAAGLLLQSLRRLECQQFGFETRGRVIVKVDPVLAGYTVERLAGLYTQLDQRLAEIPGVVSASYSLYSPMEGRNWSGPINIEGRPPATNSDERIFASWNRVGASYFETIGTRLIRGRLIDQQDTPASPRVTVISEAFARKFFPKENPIGKRLGLGDWNHRNDFEIVGIVEDAKYEDAREPAFATFFLPLLQMANYSSPMEISMQAHSNYINDIELRFADRPKQVEVSIRETLQSIDPNLIVLSVVTMQEQVERNFNQERLISELTALYGFLALFLACVGLYGVLAYSVVRRTNEIGIRMALGGQPRDVFRLVLGEGAVLVLIGAAIGIGGALGLGRLMTSLLYGVSATDPLTLMAAAAVLMFVAFISCYIPARRATRVDPMVALRYE